MKKFAIFGIITLLVMVSCNNPSDLGSTSSDDPIQYTADGRPMVAVSLGTGSSSRALTDQLAKIGFDLYEAVFKDPASNGVFYRKTWVKGETAKVYLPVGNYGTSANAILLVGASKDKNLLAVGTVTDTDATGTTLVSSTTKSITFTVVSLVTDINKTYGTTSTFALTGGTGVNQTASITGDLPTTKDGYPCFVIPFDSQNTITVSATYKLYTSTAGTPDNFFSAYAPGLVIKAPGGVINCNNIPYEGQYYTKEVTAGFTQIGGSTFTADKAFTAGGGITWPLGININIPISVNPGLCKIWIDIPVYGLDPKNSITWHIKGGFDNSNPDGGKDVNSIGGAILLSIGEVDGITIKP